MHLWKNTIFVFLSAIVFTSCKQDDPEPTVPPQTTLQQLQHRWNFQKEIYHEFTNGIHLRDTTLGMPGDYVEFKNNGSVLFNMGGSFDSLKYSVLGNDRLVLTYMGVLSDTSTISVLTSNQLQLYNKVSNPPDFYEIIDYLVR